MSYPELPDNRLIVNGIDLTTRFRMVLLDGYTLSPPEPKTYTVEVPGRDGLIDLTESLTGDVPYGNRTMSFSFLIPDLQEFETTKTAVSNFLHGKAFDFQITMDPDYTYHGRFKVTSYTHMSTYNHDICGYIDIDIDAEPYKIKQHMLYKLNATGGNLFQLASGRKKVHPVISLQSPARLKFNNVVYRLGAGQFQLNDILFEEGLNDIYINSYELQNLTWDEWKPLGPIEIRVTGVNVPDGGILFLHSDLTEWNKDLESLEYQFTDYGSYYAIRLYIQRNTVIYYQPMIMKIADVPENLLPESTPVSTYIGSTPNGQNNVLTVYPRHIYQSAWGNTTTTDVGYLNNKQYTVWDEYTNVRWDELQKTDGLISDVRQKWGDFNMNTWAFMGKQSWKDWDYRIESAPDTNVILEYDWKDL